MQKAKIKITNKLGLHLRPSSKLAQLASEFPCEIWISRKQKRVNAKSVLGITMLAAGKGSDIEIECNGEDEVHALFQIKKLFETNFNEES
jgi:phosphocarrier protein